MTNTKDNIKQLIIETLGRSDITPDDIDETVPLMENPLLEMDSIDILGIIVALQRKYKVRIDDQNLARTVIRTVNSIVAFIESSTSTNQLD